MIEDDRRTEYRPCVGRPVAAVRVVRPLARHALSREPVRDRRRRARAGELRFLLDDARGGDEIMVDFVGRGGLGHPAIFSLLPLGIDVRPVTSSNNRPRSVIVEDDGCC